MADPTVNYVEEIPAMKHILQVRTFKKMMVVLLALAWVPLTSHCQLESIPGLEFLRCVCDTQASPKSGDSCQDDGCCAVELAKYQSPRQQEITPIVVMAMLPEASSGVLEQPLPPEFSLDLLTPAPSGLSTSWQFSFRTALPVRAPSLAS